MAAADKKSSGNVKAGKKVRFRFKSTWKNILLYGFLLLFSLLIFSAFSVPLEERGGPKVPVSDIIGAVKKGDVKELTVTSNKLVAKLSDKTLIADKEPDESVYSLFKNAGVALDPTKMKVQVQDEAS